MSGHILIVRFFLDRSSPWLYSEYLEAYSNMTTMKEIADMANVSQSTVSRILNGSAGVSPSKKARVMEVVRKLNYTPNQTARSLASSRTHLIGVLLPDLMTPFFSEVLTQVERMASQNGYNIIVCNSNGSERREREALASLKARQVDGVLIGLTSASSPILEALQKQTVKAVIITQEHQGVDCVGTSHPHGGMLVARHFLEKGVEQFAFLGPDHDEKLIGFSEVLQQAGVSSDAIDVLSLDHWFLSLSDQGYKRAKNYLTQNLHNHKKIGIFAVNDSFAYGVIHAAQDLGIRIPEELVVVGFDNTYLCTTVRPMLTSIAQPTEEIGRLGVELLLKRIENQALLEEAVHMQLEPELIRRETS